MLTKNFSTQTVESSSCWFRRDYSYRTNPTTCLKCEFCYKHSTGDPERRRSASYIDKNEAFHSKTIFKTPVIISRFCEPFTDGASTDASVVVAEKCIENNCQFIFKTALELPSKAVNLLKDNKKNSQCQLRFVSSETKSGSQIAQLLSPGFIHANDQLYQAEMLVKAGVDVVAIFDPFIIGVNDMHLKRLVYHLYGNGVKKLVIKQLFATEYFLQYLKFRIDRRFTNLLGISTSGYWTYSNLDYLTALFPILEACSECKISVSLCSNRAVNEIVYGNENCCQFDNPIGFYNKEGKIIND